MLVRDNCFHQPASFVDQLARDGDLWLVRGQSRWNDARFEIQARKLVLAAGVLSSAQLAFKVTKTFNTPRRLMSTPTSAFAVLFPQLLGRTADGDLGLSQHCYVLKGGTAVQDVFGGLFSASTLPTSEFVLRAPFAKRFSIDIIAALLPAVAVGNVFFHSQWSDHHISLGDDGVLRIKGGFQPGLERLAKLTADRLKTALRALRAFALPGSFALGAAGSDAHYAGTFPMRSKPGNLETSRFGELFGQAGLYLVDGSVLPELPPKSHTLTVMANADRIGVEIGRRLQAGDGPSQP